MGKSLYIAEKPSVAREFAKALKEDMRTFDGYQESEHAVITWCVGHLVTMSYPEAYDMKFKKWSLATLPFIPETFKYEVIPGVSKQFKIENGWENLYNAYHNENLKTDEIQKAREVEEQEWWANESQSCKTH